MKDSIYFSHDADARNDERIIALRMAHGYEGYGIFWAIIELLRTATEHKMQMNSKCIAFALGVHNDIVQSVICDFDLFIVDDDNNFYSESLIRRMDKKKQVSETRRKAAQKRWDSANAMQMHSKSNANKMQMQCNKVKKESKLSKESKESNNTPKPPKGDKKFDEFWSVYPKKVGKHAALKAWKKKKPDLQKCLDTLRRQKESNEWKKDGGQFIPNPSTWLNQGRWTDEPMTEIKPARNTFLDGIIDD